MGTNTKTQAEVYVGIQLTLGNTEQLTSWTLRKACNDRDFFCRDPVKEGKCGTEEELKGEPRLLLIWGMQRASTMQYYRSHSGNESCLLMEGSLACLRTTYTHTYTLFIYIYIQRTTYTHSLYIYKE